MRKDTHFYRIKLVQESHQFAFARKEGMELGMEKGIEQGAERLINDMTFAGELRIRFHLHAPAEDLSIYHAAGADNDLGITVECSVEHSVYPYNGFGVHVARVLRSTGNVNDGLDSLFVVS